MYNYLVKFTPLEPYFFGNEKAFSFGSVNGQKNGEYYIKSEERPSQTTIFGALRYCCLNRANANFTLDENIGTESFDMEKAACQDFGVLKNVSPIFITDEKDNYYIKTPFDHKNKDTDKHENKFYSPFSYKNSIETSLGERLFPCDFIAKDEITNSYVNMETKEIKDELFKSVIKIGIKKNKDRDGFFKKEYKLLKAGYSFAVFFKTEKELSDKTVFLGQGKSAFSVKFTKKENDLEEKLQGLFNENSREIAIALSDTYVSKEIYDFCLFSNIKTKEFRNFRTNSEAKSFYDRFKKSPCLKHLAEAGSMFIVKDKENFEKLINNENCQQIGLNKVFFTNKGDK